MTTDKIEQAAKESCPNDLHFREECEDEYRCGAGVSYREGFRSGVAWARENPNDEMLKVYELLKKLDGWQGRQSCNASVYEISDDEFGFMQFFIQEAIALFDKRMG